MQHAALQPPHHEERLDRYAVIHRHIFGRERALEDTAGEVCDTGVWGHRGIVARDGWRGLRGYPRVSSRPVGCAGVTGACGSWYALLWGRPKAAHRASVQMPYRFVGGRPMRGLGAIDRRMS